MSSECNNIKLAIRNKKSEVICATCKQCLITANHDDCVLQYVNGMKSRKKIQSANVSKSANQKKHKPIVWKPKRVGSKERLASPKPSTPRSCLRWSLTGRMFDLKGMIIATSESVCQSDCYKGDNACTSNPHELIKRFPSSTFSMTARNQRDLPGTLHWIRVESRYSAALQPIPADVKILRPHAHRQSDEMISLSMAEDIKVPLILGRPFLSTARAKIGVFK
ncbi:hypothetical protein Tco_0675121 [Tanacetum coccineum]